MNERPGYFAELSESLGRGWNRFWFTPSDAYTLSVLRIVLGLTATFYLLSHTADLVRWFGPRGMLSVETVRSVTAAMESAGPRPDSEFALWSYLNHVESPGMLRVLHFGAIGVTLLLTCGAFSRVTCIATFVIVVSYAHRGPLIAGHLEPVLSMLLLYLCLAPSGAYLSIDARLARRRENKAAPGVNFATTISQRLMQVHLAAFYLMMVLNKLGYSPSWWTGDAVWWLAAKTDSRLIDWTFLASMPDLMNLWCHALVLFELSFPLLIWNRLARPLLLGASLVAWGSLALLTGLLEFCTLMALAGIVYLPADSMRRLLRNAGNE